MEGDEAGPALRLWRALARRCVGPYGEHAAAPLTLAGWVAWSTGDDLEAREAFAMALGADPGYLFAKLLHQACNEGIDPESIRRCLRTERTKPAQYVEPTESTEPTEAAECTERMELTDRVGRVPADGTAVVGTVVVGTAAVADAAVGDAGSPQHDAADSSAVASGTRRGRPPRPGETAGDRRPRPSGARPRQARSARTRPGAAGPGRTRTHAAEKAERSETGDRAAQEGGRPATGRTDGDE